MKYNETNARALFKMINRRVEEVEPFIAGSTFSGTFRNPLIHKMMEDGRFPEGRLNEVQRAWNAFTDSLADLEMDVIMPFEVAREEAKVAIDHAHKLGVKV